MKIKTNERTEREQPLNRSDGFDDFAKIELRDSNACGDVWHAIPFNQHWNSYRHLASIVDSE